jgi:hypothetical protein
MALLTSEITRLRFELGYNTLDAGAEPYISVVAVFDQVIATYLRAGATTTSNTPIDAATTATPVPVSLALITGFAAGASVVVDVDERQESATVQLVEANDIWVQLSNEHSGTYPVTVEGGESIVREILGHLRGIAAELGVNGSAIGSAGIEQVDEIRFFGEGSAGDGRIGQLKDLQMYWRDQLAGALGVTNAWRVRSGAGQLVEVY